MSAELLKEEQQHPNPKARWANRRRMAYISLICLISMLVWGMGVGTYAVIFGKTLSELSQLGMILSTLAVGFTSIIGAYVGFSTWDDKK